VTPTDASYEFGERGHIEYVHHSIDLVPEPRSARTARAFVDDHVRAYVAPETADTAVLLTSELVTNVVVHARTPMRLHLDLTEHGIRVAVADDAPRVPKARETHQGRLTGRGMNLVAALASEWGVEPCPTGKTVWFELPA
jgi:anti-sigma regulatory factor (Ser/Thr protein kinase)